jgi:glycosyltransferase involved in cell wall biosynthesis
MCSYNGEAYLREQLDSIAAQTRLPDELVVCDDVSTDATPKILENFKAAAPFPVRIHINAKRLGPVRNFEQGIGQCTGDQIFLSDQDDVWEPHKIERMEAVLCELESKHSRSTPLLVHSDLEVVDKNLKRVAPSFLNYQGIAHDEEPLCSLLLYNFVTGCACVFNRALVDLALPFPEDAIVHDWWIALCAAAAGKIGFLREPTIKYRQHGANEIGAKRYVRRKRLSREERQERNDLIRKTIKQAGALVERLGERDLGDRKSRSRAFIYSKILRMPRLVRPFRMAFSNIGPPRPGAPAWRKLTRKLRFCLLLVVEL